MEAKLQVIMLFPGQGSQYPGMGKDYFLEHAICQKIFQEADDALGEKLSDLIFEGSSDELTKTIHAQPAILAVSVAMGRWLLEQSPIRPVMMAGHSLGEYSALVLSGAMDFATAIRTVRARGRFMQEAVPMGEGTMAAVLGASDDVVEAVCKEVSAQGALVEPANYNCPGQLVISGSVDGVERASVECRKRGALKVVPLKVSAPFHSSMLVSAGERLGDVLQGVEFKPPEVPYVANVTAKEVHDASEIKTLLSDQVWKPVRWSQSLQSIFTKHPAMPVVECGPGKVVAGHVKKIDRERPVFLTDPLAATEAWKTRLGDR